MPININNEVDADSGDSASNIIKSINKFSFKNTGKRFSLPPGTVIAAANIMVTIRAPVCVYIQIQTYIYVCVCVCVCVYIYVCVYVYMYMYLYMYKNTLYWLLNYWLAIYIYTHIHVQIHIYVR